LAGLPRNKFLTNNLFQQFFKMKTFTSSSSKNIVYLSSLLGFQLGTSRINHNQLPTIIWNLYYDAKKLLQADNCIIKQVFKWLGED